MSFLRRHGPARAIKPAHPVRPRLEVLEDRCVPSTVTNLSGSAAMPGSLPFEVANPPPLGEAIQFAPNLKGGTITLNAPLAVTKAVTIDGANNGITVSGGGIHQVFVIQPGVGAVINGLTITGGSTAGDGGAIHNSGSL